MQENLQVLTVALRVLTAITEMRNPDEADLAALVAFAGPKPLGMDIDEFACEVIKRAVNCRAEIRSALESREGQ